MRPSGHEWFHTFLGPLGRPTAKVTLLGEYSHHEKQSLALLAKDGQKFARYLKERGVACWVTEGNNEMYGPTSFGEVERAILAAAMEQEGLEVVKVNRAAEREFDFRTLEMAELIGDASRRHAFVAGLLGGAHCFKVTLPLLRGETASITAAQQLLKDGISVRAVGFSELSPSQIPEQPFDAVLLPNEIGIWDVEELDPPEVSQDRKPTPDWTPS